MEIETIIGEIARADGLADGPLRLDTQGALTVAQSHCKFYEQTNRKRTYSVFTALAGTTIVAGNVAPPAAAAATVLSLLNPFGSGVNLEVSFGWLMHISGTPAAGAWAWCATMAMDSITAAEAVAQKGRGLIGGRNTVARAWSQTALTGGPVHLNTRLFPSAQFAGAVAATTPGQVVIDEVDGAIVVPPGGLLTLAPPAAGTTHVVVAGIQFHEVQLVA